VQFIATLTRATVAMDPDADWKTPVTLRVNDRGLARAFKDTLNMAELDLWTLDPSRGTFVDGVSYRCEGPLCEGAVP